MENFESMSNTAQLKKEASEEEDNKTADYHYYDHDNDNNNNNNHISNTYDYPVSLDLNLSYSPNKGKEDQGNDNEREKDDEEEEEENEDEEEEEVLPPSKSRVFSCNYCRRKFFSSQALGGHQNAHKRERSIAKRALRIGATFADTRHLSLASLPLHGSPSSASFHHRYNHHDHHHHHQGASRPSIDIQAHHGSMMMMMQPQPSNYMMPLHQHHEQGQNGYFIGGVPVFNAVPFWPGSFRRVDDEAESSTTITNINNLNFNLNFNRNNYHQLENQDSCPDLTLKL